MLDRKSIDTDTLYHVSRALDYDFALLYSIKKGQTDLNNEIVEKDKIKRARLVVELELGKEDILRLNLKKKIALLFD